MKINWTDGEHSKEVYLKLYPTSEDVASTENHASVSGTGFAISTAGYIVTNHHVVENASSIRVKGINGDFSRSYNAKVVADDKNNDIAILRIQDPAFTSLGRMPYIIRAKTIDVGSSIFCLGYPLRATMGDEVKLTNGIVSSKSGFQGDITSYQISAAVQPGNSGGPLFNANGDLVGIINARHEGAENVSYAIKSSYLVGLIEAMNDPPTLQNLSTIAGKQLAEQVKVVSKYVYIIEAN
jgi:S1-C subfamily serine protease